MEEQNAPVSQGHDPPNQTVAKPDAERDEAKKEKEQKALDEEVERILEAHRGLTQEDIDTLETAVSELEALQEKAKQEKTKE